MKQAHEEYPGLQFSFAEMQREVENLRLLAKPFLDVASFQRVLPNWRDQLIFLRDKHGEISKRWEIPEADPLKTRLSEGRYEPKGRSGKLRIYGTLSGVWEIDVKREGRHKAPRTFFLKGLAS